MYGDPAPGAARGLCAAALQHDPHSRGKGAQPSRSNGVAASVLDGALGERTPQSPFLCSIRTDVHLVNLNQRQAGAQPIPAYPTIGWLQLPPANSASRPDVHTSQ